MKEDKSKSYLCPVDNVQNPLSRGESGSVFGGTISSFGSQPQILEEEEKHEASGEEEVVDHLDSFEELAGINDECVLTKIERYQLDSHSGNMVMRRAS